MELRYDPVNRMPHQCGNPEIRRRVPSSLQQFQPSHVLRRVAIDHHRTVGNKQKRLITVTAKVVRYCISTTLRNMDKQQAALEEDRHGESSP
jgi:hypothetical protein